MEQEFVDKRKLITKEELLDMVAVGKSVPGIMITNISMLFGYYVGGWFGGVCAVLGMTCPAVLILSFVPAFLPHSSYPFPIIEFNSFSKRLVTRSGRSSP